MRTVIVVDLLSGSWKLHAFNVCFCFVFSVFVFFFLLFSSSSSSPTPPSSIVTVVLVFRDFNRTKPAFLQF